MKKYVVLLALTCVVTLAGVSMVIYKMVFSPHIDSEDFNIYIHPGHKTDYVLEQIEEKNGKESFTGLRLVFRLRDFESKIKSGCYSIKRGDSAHDIYLRLANGNQTPVNLVVKSTRTVQKMASNMAEQIMADSTEITGLLTDSLFLDSLGYSTATVFAMIVPNTYQVYWNSSAKTIVVRLAKESERFWNTKRTEKAQLIGMSRLQVVTLASIVEEETSKLNELAVVAGLYMNRLKRGMPLQADPTVIFALGGERPKRVLQTHLNVDSPYNTYRNSGLPPTPIRFVNIASIEAVLNYAHHDYLYMCAKEDFSGYHNFSRTLSQHNVNAARYRRALSANGQRR